MVPRIAAAWPEPTTAGDGFCCSSFNVLSIIIIKTRQKKKCSHNHKEQQREERGGDGARRG